MAGPIVVGDLDGRRPETPPPAGGDRRGRRQRASFVAVFVVVVLAVCLHTRADTVLSPIDELQHFDYAVKASHGEVVRRGDLFGQQALRTEACLGIDSPGFTPPPCGLPAYDPADFQEAGFNTAYIHPPAYYVVSGSIGRLLSSFGLGLLTATRLSGVVWLALALGLTQWVLAREGAPPLAQVAVLSALAVSPIVLHSSATVNADATALAAGAAVLVAVLAWEDGRVRAWVPGVVAAAAVAGKVTNVAGVVAALAYLAVRSWQEAAPLPAVVAAGDRPRLDARALLAAARRRLAAVLAMAAGVAGFALAWGAVQERLALVPASDIPMLQEFAASRLPLDDLLTSFRSTVSPLGNPYYTTPLQHWTGMLVMLLTDTGLLLVLATPAVYGARASRARAFAFAGLVTMLVMGPLVVLTNYVGQHIFVVPPARYGLAAVPMSLCAAAPALRSSPLVRAAAYAVGVVCVVLVGVRLV